MQFLLGNITFVLQANIKIRGYYSKICVHFQKAKHIVKLQFLGLRLGVDFTFTLDNNHNHNHNNHNNNDNDSNNPHLYFFKGTVLGVKEQGLGIRDKG